MEQAPTGGIATEEQPTERAATETTPPPMAGTQADGTGTDTPPTDAPE